LATLLLVAVIVIWPAGFLRIILGLPFILLFPGYTVIAALYPRKSDLGGVERLGLSLALSLATVAFIGLILNLTPQGIRLYPALISSSAFTVVISLLAWRRRRRLPADERIRISPSFKSLSLFWRGTKPVERRLSLALAAAVLGTIAILIYAAAVPRAGEKYTEFIYSENPEKRQAIRENSSRALQQT